MTDFDPKGQKFKVGSFRERILVLLHEHESLETEHTRLSNYLHAQDLAGSSPRTSNSLSPSLPVDREPWPTGHDEAFAASDLNSSLLCLRSECCSSPVPDGEEALCQARDCTEYSPDCQRPSSVVRSSVYSEAFAPASGSLDGLASCTINQQSCRLTEERLERRHRHRLSYRPSLERLQRERSIRRFAALLVTSMLFEVAISAIIFANVIYIGWAADYKLSHLEEPETLSMKCVEAGFALIFTLELLIRILAFGKLFLKPPDWSWNLFDTVLVAQSLVDQMIYVIGGGDEGGTKMSFLRFLRLGKLVKMLRVIRVMRSMREMRLILFSIMGSVKGMFWSIILILAVSYMFALVFVLACSEILISEGDTITAENKALIEDYWSSVTRGMITLFLSSSGGVDWENVSNIFLDVKPFHVGAVYYGCYCFYIAFNMCVLMNTITALVVETTFNTANKDLKCHINNVLENKADYITKLQVLFDEIDELGHGLISDEQFCAKLQDPKMIAFAETLGIEISDAQRFFDILSDDGQNSIDLETFVVSCVKMKGQALSVDLHDVMRGQKELQKGQKESQTVQKEYADLFRNHMLVLEKELAQLKFAVSSSQAHSLEAQRPWHPTWHPSNGLIDNDTEAQHRKCGL